MSKTIKVSELCYERLTRLLRPKESYSQVVIRLLDIHDLVIRLPLREHITGKSNGGRDKHDQG